MNTVILNAIGPIVHIIAGLIVPLWFYTVTAQAVDWRVLVFSVFLSLLPDIDTQTSTIGRAFPFIAEPIERRYGHRQITHSLLALSAVGLVLWLAFPADWWLLLSAYGSHLIIDTLTGTQGIPLLWPAQLRFYLLRIRPKSTGEVLLGFFAVLALIAPYFTVTHQFIRSLTPPEETLTLRPTPEPATFAIKISHVYDIDKEILIHAGDTITTGQKIADLFTYRVLQQKPATPTSTPTASPTITPSPTPPFTPSPFPTPDPLHIAELENQRSLAHAYYIRSVTASTPDPNKQAAAPSYNLDIQAKQECMDNNDPDGWRYWNCKQEKESLEATAIALIATAPPVDPLDSNIAYHQWQAAEIRYQQAIQQLTPQPTTIPTATMSPTSIESGSSELSRTVETPSVELVETPLPTPTQHPQADPYTVYAQISGQVAAVNIVSVEGNSVTIQITILIDETDPLFADSPFPLNFPKSPATRPDRRSSPAQITHIIDGDTVTVIFLQGEYQGREETIRLLGIDTPETVHPTEPPQCYGEEASAYTKTHLPEGTTIQIELDPQTGQRDKYNRILAHIWLDDGTLFNEQLITNGYATANNYGNPTIYDTRYQTAQQTAQSANIGLWHACR